MDAISELPPGPNQVFRCRHGWMIFNRNDSFVGRSLAEYGEYSPGEVELCRQLLRPGLTVVEAGANIGALTIPLAQLVGPRGKVWAFEPQRLSFQLLCANAALSNLTNIHCRQSALGDTAGHVLVPVADPRAEQNFGAMELGAFDHGEVVAVETIDGLNLSRCDLIKADVEGMELAVLRGASQTIARCRPLLYLENERQDRSAALLSYLRALEYALWWHLPPYFVPGNFRAQSLNCFPGIVSVNVLAIPASVPAQIVGLRPIGPEEVSPFPTQAQTPEPPPA